MLKALLCLEGKPLLMGLCTSCTHHRYIGAHAAAPCIVRHTAELRACPFTNEVRERVSPASPKLCHLSCMLQARPQALLCSAFLLESTPQAQACNMLRHASMRRKQAHWRQKCCEGAHHRLRQPCERNNQVVRQGCHQLV